MNLTKFATAIGLVGVTILGGVDAAKAGTRYFECMTHTTFGDTTISRPGVCSEWVSDPVAVTPEPLYGNAWVDANSNFRSGASFESGVMFQRNYRARINVHSWSEDGEWAWVTIFNRGKAVTAWTHKVNVTMDAE